MTIGPVAVANTSDAYELKREFQIFLREAAGKIFSAEYHVISEASTRGQSSGVKATESRMRNNTTPSRAANPASEGLLP